MITARLGRRLGDRCHLRRLARSWKMDPMKPRLVRAASSQVMPVCIENRTLVLSMSAHRTFVPDADVLGRAALLSGTLSRLQSYANDRKLRALHDRVLFLQAQKPSRC